jgi:hypothetical protein
VVPCSYDNKFKNFNLSVRYVDLYMDPTYVIPEMRQGLVLAWEVAEGKSRNPSDRV